MGRAGIIVLGGGAASQLCAIVASFHARSEASIRYMASLFEIPLIFVG